MNEDAINLSAALDTQISKASSPANHQSISIVESLPDSICRFSPDGTLTFVNQAFCQLLGRTRQELLGRKHLHLLSEARRASISRHIVSLHPGITLSFMENLEQVESGEASWLHWIDRGIFDPNGQIKEIQSSGRQIKDQNCLNIVTQRHTRELDALYTATTALLTTLDLETLLGRILDLAVGAIPNAQKGALHLIALDTGQLELRAVLDFAQTNPRIQQTTSDDSSYIASVVHNKRPLRLDQIQQDTPDNGIGDLQQESVAQSAIAAPLLLKEHTLGALALEASTPAAFTENDLHLLVNFANTASAAIRNAQLHAKVQKLAVTDELTGLYNRRGFFEFGEHEVARALRYDRPLAALLVDIDHFKNINDTYGHNVGDGVLRYIANLCKTNTRKVDLIGRFGGDEIIILLSEANLFTAAAVAERLRQRIAEKTIQIEDQPIEVTASVGISKLTLETHNLEELLKRADTALYAAKDAGRNRVEIR